jgi:DNA repair protein RadC
VDPVIKTTDWAVTKLDDACFLLRLRAGDLFRNAVRRIAPAMIIMHNHPSDDPSPSPEGVTVTRALVDAGKLMGIEVLDHLVIGRQRFGSLKERGLGFG